MGFFSRLFGGQPEESAGRADLPKPGNAASEEASRLARLLVSEIVLYQEEALEKARRQGNVYSALKSDIDRSRAMYDQAIDRHQVDRDYFYLELVARLAGGKSEILGLSNPDGS